MASPNTPKKRSIMAEVIEDKLLQKLVSGAVWQLPESEIKELIEKINKFRKVLAAAYKMYDKELENLRSINGNDHLPTLEFFRKPRESKKQENNLLDDLEI